MTVTSCQKRGIENLLPSLCIAFPTITAAAFKEALSETVAAFNDENVPVDFDVEGEGVVVNLEYFEISNIQGVRVAHGNDVTYKHFSADKKPKL